MDLGCGDGALTQLVVDAHPSAEVVMVDFSEPMLKRAGERLRRLRVNGSLWRADLNDPAWSEQLPDGRYDAIVSGLAIHHLPGERKRSLFAELFGLLEPGGVFVNLDYVLVEGPLQGLFDETQDAGACGRTAAPTAPARQAVQAPRRCSSTRTTTIARTSPRPRSVGCGRPASSRRKFSSNGPRRP